MANFNIDYLVVAGGGGGGNAQGSSGSGGGAGEYLYQTGQSLTTGGSGYTVTVGAGGSGGTGSSYPSANGLSGSDSFFVRSVAGGGAGLFSSPGNLLQSVPGGSGGGARPGSGSGAVSTAVSPGVGSAGGSSSGNGGGGGGGAGLAGTTGTTSLSGSGGDGLQNSITGVNTYYAGGGGGGNFGPSGTSIGSGGSGIGGTSSLTTTAGSGVNNTGSGGAGGSYSTSTVPYNGGDGGSGIVILRYTTADVAGYTTTGSTPTEDTTTISGQTILSFTTVGTGTITFTAPAIPITPFDGTRATTPVTGFNKTGTGEGLKLPSGDNSNQPVGAAAEQGMIRNDTEETVDSSDSAIAHYNGTAWQYFAATESADPVVPLENFNTVLYIGDGNTSNPQTNIGFSPNLVWIADRDGGNYNPIQDSVRGVDSVLVTALTAAEQSSSWRNSYGQITSFDSDGFNVSDGSGNTNSNFNQSGRDYVAWCWKAGGAAVPNTNGDVQSNVSANVAGGFSIVKGTGSGSGVQSAGHGLSSAPEFILVKNINATDNWFCLVPGLTSTNYYMRLNTTDAEINNGTPTIFADSTTVSVRQNSMGSWGNLIAYCFHSVPGYSKVGSFVGTGAAGLKITLDFQPAWLMIKRTSTTGAWTVIDNKINTASIKKNYIKINEIGEENTATTGIVFEIDGFSFSGGSFNQSGQTAMYLAFA